MTLDEYLQAHSLHEYDIQLIDEANDYIHVDYKEAHNYHIVSIEDMGFDIVSMRTRKLICIRKK